MSGIQDLFLNFLLILIPIFIYQSFWVERRDFVPHRNRAAITVLTAVSILLCMTFPLRLSPDYLYDLRLIPLLLGILYGGRRSGLLLIAVLFAYRLFLGGNGLWVALGTYPVVLLIAFCLAPRFRYFARGQKVMLAVLLATLSSTLVNLVILLSEGMPFFANEDLPLFAAYTLLHAFGMWLALYLIENMREKVHMRREIQRAEKLQVLGELAASLAHEIRNPMTVVRGFLQLLLEGRLDKEKEALFLRMSIEELDRSEKIITNYLSFARPKTEEEQISFDVGERIAHVTGIISSFALLRSVEIRQHTELGLFVEADPAKLSQVLVNLFKNGIEAMPTGGTLTIQASRENRRVIIDVRDTGIGMTKEETAQLGSAFYTTKESGTGLGFMVSYQLIQAMNGTIEVTSEKDIGTRFTISLPAADEEMRGEPA